MKGKFLFSEGQLGQKHIHLAAAFSFSEDKYMKCNQKQSHDIIDNHRDFHVSLHVPVTVSKCHTVQKGSP
ncbi:hypothetical protein COLO4_10832 [Corchorus olitorius]|uniref:Uncharacterized protein n=1 Tax=Corchorus olitorius TaxID=93759 RepID=A0A1R3K6U6_9ROSI|nr:hypothetical protein COLO4_10832 [Corchorus olitorius]